jgi:hypothetical protein
VVFTTFDELAAAAPELVDPPEEPEPPLPLLPELPQAAAAVRVAAARAVAHHRLRIAYLHFAQNVVSPGDKPDLTDHTVWHTYLTTYGRP